MKIPKFKIGKEAMLFGEKHRGNIEVIAALKREYKRRLKKCDDFWEIILLAGGTAQLYTEHQKLSVNAGFYREAYEVAEGKLPWPKGVKP